MYILQYLADKIHRRRSKMNNSMSFSAKTSILSRNENSDVFPHESIDLEQKCKFRCLFWPFFESQASKNEITYDCDVYSAVFSR